MQRNSRAALLAAIIGVATACGGSSSTSTGAAPEQQASVPTTAQPAAPTAAPALAPVVTETAAVAGSATTGGAAVETPAPTVAVPPILQLKAPLIGGGEFDFAGYAGKPLAVWFWAPG